MCDLDLPKAYINVIVDFLTGRTGFEISIALLTASNKFRQQNNKNIFTT